MISLNFGPTLNPVFIALLFNCSGTASLTLQNHLSKWATASQGLKDPQLLRLLPLPQMRLNASAKGLCYQTNSNINTLISSLLKKVVIRFRKLDSDSSGKLSLQELLALPELQNNPLVKRVAGVAKTCPKGPFVSVCHIMVLSCRCV